MGTTQDAADWKIVVGWAPVWRGVLRQVLLVFLPNDYTTGMLAWVVLPITAMKTCAAVSPVTCLAALEELARELPVSYDTFHDR